MAHKRTESKREKRVNEKAKGKRRKGQIFFCKFLFFRSGGEENERQLATKVNAREEFVRPTWIDLDFSSPETAPEILLMFAVYPLQRRQK